MIHFVFKDKKSIIFIIVLIIFQGVLGASVSLYISMLVDFLTNQNELKTFLIYVLIGVGIILLLFLIEYMLNKLIIKYSLNVSLSIRNDFINKLIDRNLSSLIQKEPSYFTSFVFNDLPKLCGLSEVIFNLIANGFYLVFSFAVLFYLSWQISLLAIFFLIFNLIPLFIYSKKITSSNLDVSNAYAKYSSQIESVLRGIDIVKQYKSEEKFKREIEKQSENLFNNEFLNSKLNYKQTISIHVLTSLMYFSLMLFSSFLIFNGSLKISIISVILYCSNLLTDLEFSIYKRIGALITTFSLRKKYDDLTTPSHDNPKNHITDIRSIKLENVSFAYKNRPILKNINTTFEKNKKYLIIGKSGSGKTTLLNLLLKTYLKYSGKISVDNIDYNEIGETELFNYMAYLKQKPYVFKDTIRNNIVLSSIYDPKRFTSIVNKTILTDFLSNLQFGEEEIIDENINKISEGEKQRICIARALYKGAKIFFLDEINSSLDKNSSKTIENLILNLKDCLVINIAHKFTGELISKYNKIIVIEKGRIVIEGDYRSIKDNPKFLFYKNLEGRDS